MAITKSGYLYTVNYKSNGKDTQKEIKSFKPLENKEIMAELFEVKDGKFSANITDVVWIVDEVVFKIEDSIFLESSVVSKKKGGKK